MKLRSFVLLVVLLTPAAGFAQRIPVAVSHSNRSGDQTGSLVVYNLKENIRRSAGFVLIDSDLTLGPRINVEIASLDGSDDRSGTTSALSIVMVYDSLDTPLNGYYLSSYVQVCGKFRASSCATDILPNIDKAAEELKRRSPGLWEKLIGTVDFPVSIPRDRSRF